MNIVNGFEFDDRLLPTIDLECVPFSREKLDALVHAFAEYTAAILSVKCELRVRNNARLVCIADDEAVVKKVRVRCKCKRCMGARRIAWVQEGRNVYAILYRSSNPAYIMTPQAHAQHAFLTTISDEVVCAISLAEMLEEVSRRAKYRFENIRMPATFSSEYPAYHKITHHSTFVCGGLGFRLWDAIYDKAFEFFSEVDHCTCRAYNLRRNASAEDEEHLHATLRFLAAALANKLTFTRRLSNCHACLHPSTCEAINVREFERSKRASELQIGADVAALETLLTLASGTNDAVAEIMQQEDLLAEVERIVGCPPPELVHAMDDFDLDERMLDFRLLEAATRTGSVVPMSPQVRFFVLQQWRGKEMNGSRTRIVCDKALSMLRQSAYGTTAAGTFVKVAIRVDPMVGINSPALILPTVPWRYSHTTWKLQDIAVHRKRRVGLDDIGMRTVLVSSFVWQLLGECAPPEIEDGVFSPEILHTLCEVEMVQTKLMNLCVNDDISKLLVGDEFRATKTTLMDWRSSHFEHTVQSAVANLSYFSVQDVIRAFHPRSSFRLHEALTDKVIECLPSRPRQLFREFVSPILDVLLSVLTISRTSAGFGLSNSCCNVVAEHFAANRVVQQWNPEEPLVLKEDQVEPAFGRVLHHLASQRQLVHWGHLRGSDGVQRWCFTFSDVEVKRMLLAYYVYKNQLGNSCAV